MSEGAAGCSVPDSLINSFALVAYLPDPIAGFVDAVRHFVPTKKVQPDEDARAHLTILPPRPLACLADRAAAELEQAAARLEPFFVELGEVKVFPRSDVLYLSIREGAQQLERLHETLSCGRLRFLEYFEYHPHVTLAQFVPRSEMERAAARASEEWHNYVGPRRFLLDRVTLVQNTQQNHWRNLQEFRLGAPVTA
jgi:2'-5' RNA ligase